MKIWASTSDFVLIAHEQMYHLITVVYTITSISFRQVVKFALQDNAPTAKVLTCIIVWLIKCGFRK